MLYRESTPIMEHRMEKNMEDEMETGILQGPGRFGNMKAGG